MELLLYRHRAAGRVCVWWSNMFIIDLFTQTRAKHRNISRVKYKFHIIIKYNKSVPTHSVSSCWPFPSCNYTERCLNPSTLCSLEPPPISRQMPTMLAYPTGCGLFLYLNIGVHPGQGESWLKKKKLLTYFGGDACVCVCVFHACFFFLFGAILHVLSCVQEHTMFAACVYQRKLENLAGKYLIRKFSSLHLKPI